MLVRQKLTEGSSDFQFHGPLCCSCTLCGIQDCSKSESAASARVLPDHL